MMPRAKSKKPKRPSIWDKEYYKKMGQTYDVQSEGHGNSAQWKAAFSERMGWDEAVQVMADDNPRTVLGVSKSATMADIKLAFRKSTQIWHPDKWMEKGQDAIDKATKMMKKIVAAYRILQGK